MPIRCSCAATTVPGQCFRPPLAPRYAAAVIRDLAQLMRKPAQFAGHTARFWDHPHIAKSLLAAHLDPDSDAASRRPERIDAEVSWLHERLGLQPGQRVLDLGCGPGLYAIRLAERGLHVTGMDISPMSLAYARRLARQREFQHRVAFRRQDYLRLADAGPFDVIVLIYFDFGVLGNSARDDLLQNVRRWLLPGGAFVFDVRSGPPSVGSSSWNFAASGFWRPAPYLELTAFHIDWDIPATLRQVVILQDRQQPAVYRFWDRYYAPDALEMVLDRHGFTVEDVRGDLTGMPYGPQSPGLAAIARTTEASFDDTRNHVGRCSCPPVAPAGSNASRRSESQRAQPPPCAGSRSPARRY